MVCNNGVIFLFMSLLCSATLVFNLLFVWPMYVADRF